MVFCSGVLVFGIVVSSMVLLVCSAWLGIGIDYVFAWFGIGIGCVFAVWWLLRGEIGRGLISSRCQHFSTPPPPNSAHCTEKNTILRGLCENRDCWSMWRVGFQKISGKVDSFRRRRSYGSRFWKGLYRDAKMISTVSDNHYYDDVQKRSVKSQVWTSWVFTLTS